MNSATPADRDAREPHQGQIPRDTVAGHRAVDAPEYEISSELLESFMRGQRIHEELGKALAEAEESADASLVESILSDDYRNAAKAHAAARMVEESGDRLTPRVLHKLNELAFLQGAANFENRGINDAVERADKALTEQGPWRADWAGRTVRVPTLTESFRPAAPGGWHISPAAPTPAPAEHEPGANDDVAADARHSEAGYRIPPEGRVVAGDDGYEFMDRNRALGWQSVAAWGADGWDMGRWPLICVMSNDDYARPRTVVYVEGDVEVREFDSVDDRSRYMDAVAEQFWRTGDADGPKDIAAFRPGELPESYRGAPTSRYSIPESPGLNPNLAAKHVDLGFTR